MGKAGKWEFGKKNNNYLIENKLKQHYETLLFQFTE